MYTVDAGIFMRMMDLTDLGPDDRDDADEWECPIGDEVANLIVTASRHTFYSTLRIEGVNDGFIYDLNLNQAVRVPAENVPQCDCAAHRRLKGNIAESEREDIKSLIRSSTMANTDVGCNYACALLRWLFKEMDMPQYHAERCGNEYGVSYILLREGIRSSFRGRPDYVIHKEDVGVGRIIVGMGEIQSTRNPAVQNSIYGVGSLLESSGRPILCITVFKNKSVQLIIARLQPAVHQEPNVVGLKYVVSPSPINLQTNEGVKTFCTRLHHVLKNWY